MLTGTTLPWVQANLKSGHRVADARLVSEQSD